MNVISRVLNYGLVAGNAALRAAVTGIFCFNHRRKVREVDPAYRAKPFLEKKIPGPSIKSPFEDLLLFGNSYIEKYCSGYNRINLNCRLIQPPETVKRKESGSIECRHLAYSFSLSSPEDFYKIIESRTDETCSGIINDHEWNQRFDFKCAKEAHYFKLKNLATALGSIAQDVWSMSEGASKSFVCFTEVHALSFRFKKEEGKLNIVFYDPNETLRHRTFVMAHSDEISALKAEDFFHEHYLQCYFQSPAKEDVLCLQSVDGTRHRDSCRVMIHGEIDNYWLPMRYGHWGVGSLDWGLKADTPNAENGLYLALYKGRHEVVKDYLNHYFYKANADSLEEFSLLEQCYDRPCPRLDVAISGLRRAITHDNKETVRAFVQGILDSPLDNARKVEFLRLKLTEYDHIQALWDYLTGQIRPTQGFELYRDLILNSHLPSDCKRSLIPEIVPKNQTEV